MVVLNRKVVIVGGGITGTAMARALNARGIDHLVLEKRVAATDGGLAINLPGNAMAALDRFGLADDVVRLGTPIRRREYRTERGSLLFYVDEDAFWGNTMQPHAMLRRDLLGLLGDGLGEQSILRGCAVSALEQNEQTVTASLANGHMLDAELVIGADGVHSQTRNAIMATDHRKASLIGNASWRFMIPNPGVECWTVFASKGSVILLMPAPEGEAYGWAMAERSSRDDPATLEHAFKKFPEIVRDAIKSALAVPERLHHSPLLDIRPSRWSSGRIVLAGDAAHAMAPVWAQGAALGLEDALVLTEELSATSDWIDAIRRFETRRRPRVAHVQAATDSMSRAAKLPEWLRMLVLPLVGPRRYSSTYAPLKQMP
jgi:2-polyprenyl-6-methoxyphenol hydroxylase-like FAD-dependent oxidoreductase